MKAKEKGDENLFKKMLKLVNHEPFGRIVTGKNEKTSEKFANASLSGFGDLGDSIPTGVEVQMHTQKSADYWKKDHFTFDPLKVVKGWARGSWFITPHQLQNTIIHEISEEVRNGVLQKTPNQIMKSYITSHKILVYVSKDEEVFLVLKNHKSEFEAKKPPTMNLIEKPQEHHDLMEFIEKLGSESVLNASPSIF